MVTHTATEAILVLLKKLRAHGQIVYVPSIICSSVEYLLEWYGAEVAYYDPLEEVGNDNFEKASIIIWVPYFGYSRGPKSNLLQKLPKSCKVIIDSAHSPIVAKNLRNSFGDREVYVVSSSRKITGLEDNVSITNRGAEIQVDVSNAEVSCAYDYIMKRSRSFGFFTFFMLCVAKIGLIARPPTAPVYEKRVYKKESVVKLVNKKHKQLRERREIRGKALISMRVTKTLVPMWDTDPDDVIWCVPICIGSFRSVLLRSIIISLRGKSTFIWPHYAKKNKTGSFFLCGKL